VFITGIILGLIALIGLAAWRLGSSDETKGGGVLAFFACLVLSVVCVVIASMSTVPTRNVGIVTQFNKPTGRTTGAGLQWHAPWQGVDDWDASGQAYAHLGDRCVWVAIAAQRKACIPVQIEYRSSTGRAPENWAAYKELDDKSRFETFQARRVEPQINAALISVFADFDPLGAPVTPKPGEAVADAPAPDLNKTYRQKLLDAVNVALGGGTAGADGKVAVVTDNPATKRVEEDPEADIVVTSVSFGAPTYDKKTQEQIDAYGQKVLEARNLAVDETNADTRKRITAKNASVNQTTRCLEIAEKAGKEPGLCMGSGVALTRPVS
jgi:hypothetical protein